jgi:hypothetical protein
MLLVTGLLAMGVAYLLTPSQLLIFKTSERRREEIAAHPASRDRFVTICYYRELDRQLAPDARIFFSGVVGPNNRLYYYYFARSCLFPREVEISFDHKADFQAGGFVGMDCASPEQLRTNGYDVMLQVGKDGNVSASPLTEKGALKQ